MLKTVLPRLSAVEGKLHAVDRRAATVVRKPLDFVKPVRTFFGGRKWDAFIMSGSAYHRLQDLGTVRR